jgi:drug/metabolite transporter (DMT)-like permease
MVPAVPPRAVAGGTPLPAIAALTLNAFVWGVSWWPFRQMQAQGLHPLWCTAAVYGLSLLVIAARWPTALGRLLRTPSLWALVLASGTTNATFNWAVSIGDVVRVVLLFYLMPLWAVLLARLLLHERLTRLGVLRIVLALAGAAIVLKPEGRGWPLPASLPDWLGVAGGFSFALNNVLLRREAQRPAEARAMAMFAGGVVVSAALATALATAGVLPPPPAPRLAWALPVLGLALAFLAANLALQYGAVRLRANVTAVVMLTEILFATASAVGLGDQALTAAMAAGGLLILGAAALSAWEPEH